jgi:two-component system chemotaxis response regulator CheB
VADADLRWQAVVMGCSAGGIDALRTVLAGLPAAFPLPVVIVSHTGPTVDSLLPEVLRPVCPLPVDEASERCPVVARRVHVAPPGYHLLIEADHTFALSVDAKVRNVRPAIDVLFASAADAYGDGLICVVMTGANDDGSRGLAAVKAKGGFAIVQDPETAFARAMPEAAIATGRVDRVVPLGAIAAELASLAGVAAR